MEAPLFRETPEDAQRFIVAIEHACCHSMGAQCPQCPRFLCADQRYMDHVLWLYRERERLFGPEFSLVPAVREDCG